MASAISDYVTTVSNDVPVVTISMHGSAKHPLVTGHDTSSKPDTSRDDWGGIDVESSHQNSETS